MGRAVPGAEPPSYLIQMVAFFRMASPMKTGGGRVMSTNLRAPMAGHSAVIAQLGAAIQAHSLGALLVDVDSLTATLDHNFTPCWI